MQIAVMGAGAVGCYYGAMLALGGHAVSLIGRAAHVEAVRRQGLQLQTAAGTQAVAVVASTTAEAARGAALVLLCVKATDTEPAGAALLPHLAPGAQVLCLQNGIDNVARLKALPGWQAVSVDAAVVYVAAEMAGPGHVLHRGRGDLTIGTSPRAAALKALFSSAGVALHISGDLRSELWGKLVINCVYNALSAVLQLPYGVFAVTEEGRRLIDALLRECLDVATAQGVRLPAETENTVRRLPESMPEQRSSTAQDLARGRPSEIDFLNGAIVRMAATHGIAVPVNRTLLGLVRLLEASALREA
ncbi:MAG: ketopantoate reductase family protein [Pseudomonadota bacterium]|nr:ketopantoate reductase family protein [Pseudomonadota bacterium]